MPKIAPKQTALTMTTAHMDRSGPQPLSLPQSYMRGRMSASKSYAAPVEIGAVMEEEPWLYRALALRLAKLCGCKP